MKWEREAETALGKAPFFVRGMIRKKLEERVGAAGRDVVTLRDFKEAEARFKGVAAGKSEAEISSMMPAANEAGAQLLIVENCHGEMTGCPNTLIHATEWRDAIVKWAEENGINEKLRARVIGDRVLFHHKFRISVSGCPNACSRPQVADVGIVGCVVPVLDPESCTVCGECALACRDCAITVDGAPPVFNRGACLGCKLCRDACPSGCISLTKPAGRLMAGGKLGRHPRFATVIGVHDGVDAVLPIIDKLIHDYIENSRNEERFADYFARAKK